MWDFENFQTWFRFLGLCDFRDIELTEAVEARWECQKSQKKTPKHGFFHVFGGAVLALEALEKGLKPQKP